MLKHEFYRKYANTPTVDRDFYRKISGMTITLQSLYWQIKKLDDQINPLQSELDGLLRIAGTYYESHS